MATIVFHRTGAGVYSHVVINEFEEENFPLIHKVKDFEEHIESSVRNDEMFVPVFRDVPGEGLKMKVASS